MLEVLRVSAPDVVRAAAPEVDDGVDLVLRSGTDRILVSAKQLGAVRREDLLGRVALSVLELRRHAKGDDALLVVIAAPKVSPRMCEDANRFLKDHAPDVSLIVLDDDWTRVVHGMRFGVGELQHHDDTGNKPTVSRGATRIFADKNAWMLKVLLARDLPATFWGGPKARVDSVGQLALVAQVSQPHASRFVSTFEELDFVRKTKEEGIVVVRRAELLRQWMEHEQLSRRPRIYLRSNFGKPDSFEELFDTETVASARATSMIKGRARPEVQPPFTPVAAGFEACRRMGLLVTEPPPLPELYAVGGFDPLLGAFDLDQCDARDAHFCALKADGHGTAVVRGSIANAGAVRCVDVIQAALDVSSHAARGREQAEHILDVLQWGGT